MKTLNPAVLDALSAAHIDGTNLTLNSHLDRTDYRAVDSVLRNLGGSWSRKANAHVFPHDPSEAIQQVVDTGQAPGPARTEEGFVRTPRVLADRIVREFTDIGDWNSGIVLEPSAGDGAFVQAIGDATAWSDTIRVVAVEPNQQRTEAIPRRQCSVVTGRLEDFLHSAADLPREFDAVIANPPFAMPGRPTVWIDHTWHAWSMIKPGGRLVSIAPQGLGFRDDRKHREIRYLIDRNGGGWMRLDDDAFAESGTQVRGVVFWIDKPTDWAPEADRPKKRRGKPTEEEKAERRAEDQELKAAVDEALEDDAYTAELTERINRLPIDCRLRGYSARNQALVLSQADALGVRVTGHLNTFRGWAEQGRMVTKGSTALRIVAAMGDEEEKKVDEQQQDQEQSEEKSRRRFRFTTRFDFSQTKDIDE